MGTSSRVRSRRPGPWSLVLSPGTVDATRPRLPGWTPELHAACSCRSWWGCRSRRAAAPSSLPRCPGRPSLSSKTSRPEFVRGENGQTVAGGHVRAAGTRSFRPGAGACPGGCSCGRTGQVTLATLGHVLPAASLPLCAWAGSGARVSSLARGATLAQGPAGAGHTSVISLSLVRGGSATPVAGSWEPVPEPSAQPWTCPLASRGAGHVAGLCTSHFLSGTGDGQRLDRGCGVACLTQALSLTWPRVRAPLGLKVNAGSRAPLHPMQSPQGGPGGLHSTASPVHVRKPIGRWRPIIQTRRRARGRVGAGPRLLSLPRPQASTPPSPSSGL